ncbi:patatin-like phospholipase family protein [Lewinella sp. JB7]|uniref:patatin-like phospholipase family protein n=1 Tax=Lewinella sp. JB7 TaxID=2962887 RepID=UPI0020C9620B|nr:patatin-like phospholipase family protein [Lewinella sp. JB7]MCP9237790.1 patatin-like phospholipase family protein [Lewinella sp. JB7]
MKKTALVLSGGGFKGAFQVGALQVLRDRWPEIAPGRAPLSFDIVAGVSVGSLNGLLVAQRQFGELEKLWNDVARNGVEEIYTSDFIDTQTDPRDPDPELKLRLKWSDIRKHFPATTRNLLLRAIFNRKSILREFTREFQSFRAVADNGPLRDKLLRLAKREAVTDCIYRCGYVSLNDGKYYSTSHDGFRSNQDFADGVLASTAMPVVWEPVGAVHTTQGIHRQLVDGGIRNSSPLGDVIREIGRQESEDEYTIVIINCSSGKVAEEDFTDKNIVQIALRSLVDVAITEIFNNDIREFLDKNYILKQFRDKLPDEPLYDYNYHTGGQGKPLRYFNAIVIGPDANVLGDTLTASAAQIEHRIRHGREKAAAALEKHLKKREAQKSTVV